MACSIRHGAPGSYKTSYATWYNLLPALKAGRLVITNIRGIKSKQEIEKELGEELPETADVWRVTTNTPDTIELMRNWFNWAPVGALIIIDEIQKVFPKNKNFDPTKYTHRPVTDFAHQLPAKYLERFYDEYDHVNKAASQLVIEDDLGNKILDENGNLMYPATFADAFMEHRHYNWDVICCTPEIGRVHPDMRDVCDAAFSHRSKDSIGKVFPYYMRRPRVYEHKPQQNGVSPAKGEIVVYPKIPVRVHDFYQSTTTGKHSEGTKQTTPLSSPKFIFGMVFLLCFFAYIPYYFLRSSPSEQTSTVDAQKAQGARVDTPQAASPSSPSVTRNEVNKDVASPPVLLSDVLPWPYDQIVYVGHQKKCNKYGCKSEFFFELKKDGRSFNLNSEILAQVEVDVVPVNECLVRLQNGELSVNVYCPLTEQLAPEPERNTSGQPSLKGKLPFT